jgi:Holliday junction resolvasome RuvABC endonuclease subunit
LKRFLTALEPDLIVMEDAKFTGQTAGSSRSAMQLIARAVTGSELLGGLKVIVSVWAEEHGVPVHAVGSHTIKKYATGHGNSGKEAVIAAANDKFGTTFDPATYASTGADNICDAAFCCVIGLDTYSEGMT